MNILSYDYHSAFEPAVNHHAPLYSLEEDNEYNYDAELNIVSNSNLVVLFGYCYLALIGQKNHHLNPHISQQNRGQLYDLYMW